MPPPPGDALFLSTATAPSKRPSSLPSPWEPLPSLATPPPSFLPHKPSSSSKMAFEHQADPHTA